MPRKVGHACYVSAGNLGSPEGKGPFPLLWHHELRRMRRSCGKVSILPTATRESPAEQEPVIIDCCMRVFVENGHAAAYSLTHGHAVSCARDGVAVRQRIGGGVSILNEHSHAAINYYRLLLGRALSRRRWQDRHLSTRPPHSSQLMVPE